MPKNNRIIDALTLCLKQKSNKDFKLNKSAAYAGLTDLYELYALENKTEQFFEAFAQLCMIPDDYLLGDNLFLDNFIIQLAKVFHPKKQKKRSIVPIHGGKSNAIVYLLLPRPTHPAMYITVQHYHPKPNNYWTYNRSTLYFMQSKPTLIHQF